MCQIKEIEDMGSDDPKLKIKKSTNKIIEILKIPHFIQKVRSYKTKKRPLKKQNFKKNSKTTSINLKPGDNVRVKSKEQILQTLDKENKLEGCFFMDEMYQYCETEQKVLKRVKYFYDEREAEYYKAHNTVILKDICCSGKLANFMPKCDRNCFLFWKEEWLEKIE